MQCNESTKESRGRILSEKYCSYNYFASLSFKYLPSLSIKSMLFPPVKALTSAQPISFGSYDLQLLINPYDSHFSHHQPLSDASQSPIPAYCSSQYLFLLSHDISYLKQSNKNRCSHHNTHNNRHQRFRRIQKRGT